MKIYLIDRETNVINGIYSNVDKWSANFVEYTNNGLKTKIYCDSETEYFTNEKPKIEEVTND